MLVPPGAQPARPFGGAGPSPTPSRSGSRNDLFAAYLPSSPTPPPPPLRSNDLFSTNWSPAPPPPPPLPSNDLFSTTWSPSLPPPPLPRNDYSSTWNPKPTPHSLTPRRLANLTLDSPSPPHIAHSHTSPSHPSHIDANATSHAPGPLPPPPIGAPPVSPPGSPEYPSGALLARRLAAAKSKAAMREPLELDTTPPRTSSLTAASVELSPADSPRTPAETKYAPLAHFGDPITNPASRPPSPPSPPQPVAAASKTSSFFASSGVPIPPPALANISTPPSPLALSRAASLRRRGGATSPSSPSFAPGHAHTNSHTSAPSHLSVSPPNLSPLHQSPSLAPQWVPPSPTATDDVQLRLFAEPGYLLGEGRYATVYLASFKKRPMSPTSLSPTRANNGETGWKLCAAKRLAPDRESQTMGLREAFFLNRLGTGKGRGQVYVIKLIAVKDDTASLGAGDNPHVHVMNESRALQREMNVMNTDSPPRRLRASTIYAGGRGAEEVPPLPDPSRLVLVVEHAPLGTLDRLLRTSPGLVGPQLWGRWAREAASALEWVHGKGVVHADVKPSNLLLTTDLHLRLSDFGSSLLIHPEHPPTDGVGLGTLPFSPPELVDPTAPFSFPVDIFALGATLYQCLTGREPYRGARPVEMMHYVRNGGLWQWLERDRLARVGTQGFFSATASPYPSAWRADPLPGTGAGAGAEVRRGGSLRVPHSHTPSLSVDIPSTPLKRVGSAESIVASTDAGRSAEDSPAGVRLWAAWHHGRHNGVDRLLSEHPSPPRSPVSRASSIRSPLRHVHGPDTNAQPEAVSPPLAAAGYADGAPAMFFLGAGTEGAARVPDAVRDVLRAMMEPAPEGRPGATEILGVWDEVGVGVGEDEEAGEEGTERV
ncbi:kinase-like protein [Cutaneotrichosporon oleaginosum]|uniref:Kinase-like protein n=1 Tax=Cutaneotrichosporon oleaginosum TaxID=879819 RepID=A0A0J0XKF6_9TREE|nr:kinase-like protein [Cutaneotrichosporon oleaginosum]KLT41608.1 kinase-like protein [Cutaneotrichosporon oleaginosum]TXT08153.1 hypothetical protein COLE_05077 [Cutaneotrichosporon oleaginosum]